LTGMQLIQLMKLSTTIACNFCLILVVSEMVPPQELIELSRPLPFTFHRAFDEVSNPLEAFLQLIDLGVERVLTSGQQTTAESGLEVLKELNIMSNGRIIILAGSGITPDNALKFKQIGLKEIHASASSLIEENNSLFSMPLTYSNPQKIKAILDAI
jgi:copper homeostasis protein